MATHIKILSKVDIDTFENPPNFNISERRSFFSVPLWADKIIDDLRTPTNKIGFILQLGYFRATTRFFTANRFPESHILFVCTKLNLEMDSVDFSTYRKRTFERHQNIILKALGYSKFSDELKKSVYEEALDLCSRQIKPRTIFISLLDYLRMKRIEIPKYYTISTIITEAVKCSEIYLVSKMNEVLNDETKDSLDKLLEVPENEDNQKGYQYRITLFKKSNQSVRPGKIKENISDLNQLECLFNQTIKIAESINLSETSIRFYANLAIKGQVFQIYRREENRYLLLIAFVIHQYYRLNDTMIDALLLVSQNAKNSAFRLARDKYYEDRQNKSRILGKISATVTNELSKLDMIQEIVLGSKSDKNKVSAIKELFKNEKASELVETREALEALQTESSRIKNSDYYDELESCSLKLQNRASQIIKHIKFQSGNNTRLMQAIEYFKRKEVISNKPPVGFLEDDEKKVIYDDSGKLRVSLYKALLFMHAADAIKSGSLNLVHSFKYKSFDQYLIPKNEWELHKKEYLEKAGLTEYENPESVISGLKKILDDQYQKTNENINNGENQHVRFDARDRLVVSTPKVEKEIIGTVSDFFPKHKPISLFEILSTINTMTSFTDCFEHPQIKYNRKKPKEKTFFAGIIGYGCNLGIGKIAKISNNIKQNELENTVNWYFTVENLDDANDRVLRLTDSMHLTEVYDRADGLRHTSSDGKKYNIGVETLDASYSYKYFGQGMGVSCYIFIDNRHLLLHSTVMTPSEREAANVIDGLMHNDVVQSNIHSTDTHGYSEIIFGISDLLGISFAPRIKNFKDQKLYTLEKTIPNKYKDYKICPEGTINKELIYSHWDDILRFVVTIKLKNATAYQLFKRLSSYSRQHSLYKALKQLGRITKSIFLLKYIDELDLRQAIEKQLNKVESVHKLEDAVYFGRNQEFQENTRQEQLITEGCKRLIENCVICWNYMFLSQLIADSKSASEQEHIIDILSNGSIVTWQHVNFQGEYDFSENMLKDRIKFDLSKLLDITINRGEKT